MAEYRVRSAKGRVRRTTRRGRQKTDEGLSRHAETVKGTLIDSTIFHTSDQLMESIVDVLFQFRNPASQSQISSLSIPVCVSIDVGRRRPEGRWEPPPPIQPHGRPLEVGPRAFCRIACTICQSGQAGARMLRHLRRKSLSPTASLPDRGRARGA